MLLIFKHLQKGKTNKQRLEECLILHYLFQPPEFYFVQTTFKN